MKFFYNLMDGFNEQDRFYDEQTIRRFRVYPVTQEIEKEVYENPRSDLWPVHDIHMAEWFEYMVATHILQMELGFQQQYGDIQH